jgi:hypothetical protein
MNECEGTSWRWICCPRKEEGEGREKTEIYFCFEDSIWERCDCRAQGRGSAKVSSRVQVRMSCSRMDMWILLDLGFHNVKACRKTLDDI